jgi:plastocyanin
MRRTLQLGATLVLATASLVGVRGHIHSGATAHAQQVKDTPRITLEDSNASFAAGNTYLGTWSFAPAHVAVTRGEMVEFDNPSSNYFPHTVTSLSWSGTAPDRTLASGTLFNSSPTKDQYIAPGSSWMLDTSTLDPGQYVYYCTVHPWMVGTLTVEPAQ